MAPRQKLTWKTILPGCFSTNNGESHSSEPNLLVSNQISSQRISLSELSNPGSPISVNDLSHIIFNLHVFALKELEMVTDKFSKSNFIGEGGFGRVYKGFVDGKLRPGLKAQLVAVKVLNLDGFQGHREWLAEVIFLGQLKHPHLVNLIGYCCEDEHRLLVYEYMERGNLEAQLFKRYSITLPWLTRLKIAVGAAKGLSFLHEEQKPIIYRDFKASNILLDSEYNTKLSDFGLATDGPEGDKSHITTRVMGTEGYAAPEYIMTGHLTTRSDVFSFGVVLLELLTGRRSLDKSRPRREQNLIKWARPLLKDPHKLDQIMDPRLEGQFSTEGAKKAATLAYHCLSYHSKCRPHMSTVVKTLVPLLELKDIPTGPFVYVVPIEGGNNCHNDNNKEEENQIEVIELKNGDKIGAIQGEMKKIKGCQRNQKRRKNKRQVKSLMSGANYSDTALYKTLGSSLYSPRL